MNDVHGGVIEQCFEARIRGPECFRGGTLRRRSDDADDLDSEPPKRVHVQRAGKAGADDAGLHLRDVGLHPDLR